MSDLFAYPQLLWLLVYGVALTFLLTRWIPKKRNRLVSLVVQSPQLRPRLAGKPEQDLRQKKAWLFVLALCFILLALLGPQWGRKSVEFPSYAGSLIFVLDISDSMLAQDIKPSRLERAKLEITEVFLKNQDARRRFGLVTFAARAYLQCPLTLDVNAVKFMLAMVAPNSIPYPGTNIAAGLKTASLMLAKSSGRKNILLITDGETHEGDAKNQAKELVRQGIHVHVLWIGSPGGEPIPLRDENGNFLGYKKDKEGQTVISRAESATLEEVAKIGGGKFIRLEEGLDAQSLLREILSAERNGQKKDKQTQLENRFQIPLAVGLLLMLIEFILPERKR